MVLGPRPLPIDGTARWMRSSLLTSKPHAAEREREIGWWRENLDAVEFLKRIRQCTAASGSSSLSRGIDLLAQVSAPVYEAGLLWLQWKWASCMHPVPNHATRPDLSETHTNDMTFGLHYASLGACSSAIPTTKWCMAKARWLTRWLRRSGRKFASSEPITASWGYPGKKPLVPGQEFASAGNGASSPLDGINLDDPRHHGMQDLVATSDLAVHSDPALAARDAEPKAFECCRQDSANSGVCLGPNRHPASNRSHRVQTSRTNVLTGYQVPMPHDVLA